jgi:hypothetical protein
MAGNPLKVSAAPITEQTLRDAFRRMEEDAERIARDRARFAAAWEQAFPRGTSHFAPDEQAFLAFVQQCGYAGLPIHPKDFDTLEQLRTRA